MKYAEWILSVPAEIKNDPIWKLEVYRLALFAGDIGWQDVVALSKTNLMYSVADQLHRSLGSISANLTEGYSRSKGSHRIGLITHIIGMLTPMIPHQRKKAICDEQAKYLTSSSIFSPDSEIPMP